jgi:hypothetical protein
MPFDFESRHAFRHSQEADGDGDGDDFAGVGMS